MVKMVQKVVKRRDHENNMGTLIAAASVSALLTGNYLFANAYDHRTIALASVAGAGAVAAGTVGATVKHLKRHH